MAERAGLFEEDFDVSAFVPKQPVKSTEPPSAVVRTVSESANFKSREPVQPPAKKADRRHRTGRNEQINVKVDDNTFRLFYEIYDTHREREGWVQGQVIERALKALQKELERG